MAQSRIPVWVALVGSGVAGMLVAVQTRINGGLGQQLENGYIAAAVSFSSGLVIIGLVAAFSARSRTGVRRLRAEVRSGHLPKWALIGGTFGAVFVLMQGLVAGLIGVALFTIGVVAGQVLGGLVMDRIGVGPAGRVSPTIPRIIGAVLVIVAVSMTVWVDLSGGPEALLVVAPLLAGLGISFQSAVNGLVRAASQSAVTATLLNFIVGTTLLFVLAAISIAVSGWPQNWPTSPVLYVGGSLGVVFIALAAVLVRTAGVLLLSMSNVAGQLIAAAALESVLPLAGGVSVGMLIGTAAALIAVVIAALPTRRRGVKVAERR